MSDIKMVQDALAKIESEVQTTLGELKQRAEDGEKGNQAAVKRLDDLLKNHSDLASVVEGVKGKIEELEQKGVNHPDGNPGEVKTLARQFTESEQFKAFASGNAQKVRFEAKATLINDGNDTSRHDQVGGVQGVALRRLTVVPTLDQGAATSNIIYYSRENAFTNAADGQGAEGTTKPESTVDIAEVNDPIITVAHFIPVSKQALDDSDFLASYLDTRMGHGVQNKVEAQIVAGLAASGQLSGWADTGNSTATNPVGTGNIFGLANKMKYEIIAADYEPAFYYFNPVDWAALETTQRGTGDAAYVGASGAVNYVNNGLTALLWGLPVVLSNNVPAGTIYCKAREADMLATRMGTMVEMFEQDSDNVQKNLVTVRAEWRGARLSFAPAAIRSGLISAIT